MPATIRRALIIVALAAFAATAPAGDLRREPVAQGDAQAGATKAQVCATCHGPEGISAVPIFPNLAGQPATYHYVQLRAYRDGSRANPVMAALVESLSDQDMKDIAAYYATLRPEVAPAPAAAPNDAGKALYLSGDPARGVPACQGCHGSDGRGPAAAKHAASEQLRPHTPWHTFPALAGQPAPYVAEQLKAYRDGPRLGSTNARIMHAVVRNLDDAGVEALAAYLAALAH